VGGEFGDGVLPGVAYMFFGAKEGESACLLDSLRFFFFKLEIQRQPRVSLGGVFWKPACPLPQGWTASGLGLGCGVSGA